MFHRLFVLERHLLGPLLLVCLFQLPGFEHGKLKTLLGWTTFDVFFTITAGTKNLLEQQTAKKYPVALSDSRIAGNFSSPKLAELLSTGSVFISGHVPVYFEMVKIIFVRFIITSKWI